MDIGYYKEVPAYREQGADCRRGCAYVNRCSIEHRCPAINCGEMVLIGHNTMKTIHLGQFDAKKYGVKVPRKMSIGVFGRNITAKERTLIRQVCRMGFDHPLFVNAKEGEGRGLYGTGRRVGRVWLYWSHC